MVYFVCVWGRVAGGGGGHRHDLYYMLRYLQLGWPETRRVLYQFCCANYSWAGQRHDVYYNLPRWLHLQAGWWCIIIIIDYL